MKQLLLFLMLLPILLFAQLKEFEIRELASPAGIALVMDHPDCAQIIVHSQIKDLRFESNMAGIKEQRYNAREDKYLLFITTQRQIITVKASGYIENQLSSAFSLAAKERKYFTISEKQGSSSVSNKGSFLLDTIPSGAEISIDGLPGFRERTPYRFTDYMAMTYNLNLKLKGYDDMSYQMQIKANQQESVTLALKANFAELVIVSTPVATLYLNDVAKGNTPINFQGATSGLSPGEYKISLRQNKYFNEEETIVLKAGESIQKSYSLRPNFTEMIITSSPSGSMVYLGNRALGSTPLNLMGPENGVSPGKHRIRVVPNDANYNTYDIEFELKPGKLHSQKCEHVDMRRWLKLNINQKPSRVFLDGKRNLDLEQGRDVQIVSASSSLRVIYTGADKEHYPPYEEQIKLFPGEKLIREIKFSSFKAKVNLVSDFENISLRLTDANNKTLYKGKADASLQLFPGKYTVKAQRKYFQPLDMQLSVNSEAEQFFELNPRFKSGKPASKRNEMLLSSALFAAFGSVAVVSKLKADDYYEDYKSAGVSSVAADLRDKTKTWDTYTQVSAGAGIACSMWMISSIRNYIYARSTAKEVKRIRRFDTK